MGTGVEFKSAKLEVESAGFKKVVEVARLLEWQVSTVGRVVFFLKKERKKGQLQPGCISEVGLHGKARPANKVRPLQLSQTPPKNWALSDRYGPRRLNRTLLESWAPRNPAALPYGTRFFGLCVLILILILKN